MVDGQFRMLLKFSSQCSRISLSEMIVFLSTQRIENNPDKVGP